MGDNEKEHVTVRECGEVKKTVFGQLGEIKKSLADLTTLVNDRNNKDAYDRGVKDGLMEALKNKTMSTKKLLAIITAATGSIIAILEAVKGLLL